jgi:hypothetical protein
MVNMGLYKEMNSAQAEEELRGAVYDNSFLRNARLSAKPNDPWSILRRSYTGPNLLFHVLFMLAFLTPYVAKTVFLLGVNEVQQGIQNTTEAFHKHITESEHQLTGVSPPQPVLNFAEEIRRITPCLREKCKMSYVWQVLIGADLGPSYWALAVALLLYNFCRAILTSFVAPLRDQEERSGFTPPFKRPPDDPLSRGARDTRNSFIRWMDQQGLIYWRESYGWLMYPHRVVRLLWYVAIISFAWHLIGWLGTPIYLPVNSN